MRGFPARFRSRAAVPGQPSTPAETRIYAVGDIHGCADLLVALHERILADAGKAPARRHMVVYVGDYIDRGPQAKAVIETLLGGPLPGFESVYLKGNHEAMMLDFLAGRDGSERWLDYGGKATLASYGVRAPASLRDRTAIDALRAALAERVPAAHRAFLDGLKLTHVAGDYLFVHAGIQPKTPLAAQTEDDLLWIRDGFLGYGGQHEKVVVHGHSVARRPEILANRICVDTGAYATGVLTCAVLDGVRQDVMAARREASA